MASRKPTIAALKKLAAKHGGRVESDGCGGFEVLAPPDRKWIEAEVQCLVLPLPEYDSDEERDEEIQRAMDIVSFGHEPY